MTARRGISGSRADLATLPRALAHSRETAARDGFLQRVHPTVKLVGLLALVVMAAGSNDSIRLSALLALAVGLGLISKISLRPYAAKVAIATTFAVIVVAPHAVLTSGPRIGALPVTTTGVGYVGLFGLRVGTCVAIVALLPATTRFADLLDALRRLRLPAGLVAVVGLTHRYLHQMALDLDRTMLAQRSRSISRASYRTTWRSWGRLLGAFFLRAFERAEGVSRAAQARGGRIPNPYAERRTLGARDLGFAGLVLAVVMMVLVP